MYVRVYKKPLIFLFIDQHLIKFSQNSTSTLFFLLATSNAVLPNLSGSMTILPRLHQESTSPLHNSHPLQPYAAQFALSCQFFQQVVDPSQAVILQHRHVLGGQPCGVHSCRCIQIIPVDEDHVTTIDQQHPYVCPLVAAYIRGIALLDRVLISPGSWSSGN